MLKTPLTLKNMKAVIVGTTGYFGSALKSYLEEKNWEIYDQRVDFLNLDHINNVLEEFQPDVVINAAGKTGTPNVDWCEDHPSETYLANVSGPINLASACHKKNIYFVHIGSGCIYQGDNNGKGFTETDTPNYLGSLYSRSKILSEEALKEFNALQLRVRIPVSEFPHRKNVIDKLLNYEKIISVENSFTVLEDFLPATEQLIAKKITGIVNMTNIGSMDHEFLMSQYKAIVDPNYSYTIMSLEELKKYTKAERSNTILDVSLREDMGVHMPDIKERIPQLLEAYKKHSSVAIS